LIAQQFERAGQSEKAIHYWRQAGERDLRRFAMKESIAHYSNALRLVIAMPEAPQRSALELEVCLRLALAQLIGIGPTAKDPAATYQRALTLSGMLPGRGRERFLATWGIWFNHTVSGRTAEAAGLADELVTIARELDDTDLLVEAYHARVPTLMRKPDLAGMRETAEEVVRLYDRERHRDHAYYFGGHDSRVCAQSFCALSLWGLGFPDQAEQMARRCIEDGRDLGHSFSLAHGLNMGSLTFLMLGDVDACRAVADELYPLAERNKFYWPLTQARFLRGWLAAEQDVNVDVGIEEMLKVTSESVAAVLRPIYLGLIAAQQIRAERLDGATSTLDRAADEIRRQQIRFYEPEIIRLGGEILLAQSPGNTAPVEAAFRQAKALAAEQSCRILELRAAVSLARLFDENGRKAEARELLAPVYDAFTEGFARADLQAAKTLLVELA
jgi:predicted ATPase